MLNKSETERKELEKENETIGQLMQFQKQLINKQENETARMSHVYSKLAASQKRLIALLEAKYNEILHSLIDSFDEIDSSISYENKVEEIQTDLNNLIQILGNGDGNSNVMMGGGSGNSLGVINGNHEHSLSSMSSLERPLHSDHSPYSSGSIRSMRRMLSEHLLAVESSESSFSDMSWTPNYDESFYVDLDLNMNHSLKSDDYKVGNFLFAGKLFRFIFFSIYEFDWKDDSQRNSLNSSTLMMSKSDFECQCNFDDQNLKDETPNELVEENKCLVSQLDAKSEEIKQLKEKIEILEAAAARSIKNDVSKEIMSNKSKIEVSFASKLSQSRCLSDNEKKDNDETNSLEDLIANYMNLIKGYRSLVEQLDQARCDNSQLKNSYDTLNQKYASLKSTKIINPASTSDTTLTKNCSEQQTTTHHHKSKKNKKTSK